MQKKKRNHKKFIINNKQKWKKKNKYCKMFHNNNNSIPTILNKLMINMRKYKKMTSEKDVFALNTKMEIATRDRWKKGKKAVGVNTYISQAKNMQDALLMIK